MSILNRKYNKHNYGDCFWHLRPHHILRLHTGIGQISVGSNISGAATSDVLKWMIESLISVRLTDVVFQTPRMKPKPGTSSGFEFAVCQTRSEIDLSILEIFGWTALSYLDLSCVLRSVLRNFAEATMCIALQSCNQTSFQGMWWSLNFHYFWESSPFLRIVYIELVKTTSVKTGIS